MGAAGQRSRVWRGEQGGLAGGPLKGRWGEMMYRFPLRHNSTGQEGARPTHLASLHSRVLVGEGPATQLSQGEQM